MTQKERKAMLKRYKAELLEAKERDKNGEPLSQFQKQLLIMEENWYARRAIILSYIAIALPILTLITNAVTLIILHYR